MRFVLLVSLAAVLTPSLVHAHNVGVQCDLIDGKVVVHVFYDDGTDSAGAKVRVVNAKGDEVGKGVTDAKGKWRFNSPDPGKYVVHVDAGVGHHAEATFTVPSSTTEPRQTIGDAPTREEATAKPQTISDGPRREEATATPWLKIIIGLVAIAGLAAAFLLAGVLWKNQ